jgi:hypothetical protein
MVAVSGTTLSLTVSGTVCSTAGSAPKRLPPGPVLCNVPALDAGVYSFSGTNQSIAVPSGTETVFPACP